MDWSDVHDHKSGGDIAFCFGSTAISRMGPFTSQLSQPASIAAPMTLAFDEFACITVMPFGTGTHAS